MWFRFFFIFGCLLSGLAFASSDSLFLKENLKGARPGDYLVVSSNKTNTLMHIFDKKNNVVTVEEVSVPDGRRPPLSWKEWILANAPGNTSWVMYDIDLTTGQMLRYFSFTKNGWYSIPDADNFLSKLLNLKLTRIDDAARKRVGPKGPGIDRRALWQPRMIVDGKPVNNVFFDAWRTRWARDGSELSGKVIDIYLPKESELYPAYFPYWLQINGAIGKAKIRIIDSGRHLHSPKSPLPPLQISTSEETL
ncbi:MAG: hypothetical protein LW832_09935 [Parachlamydia sp.]|jgi:hypothetical protein|nr:hypothetical protein [Parachlamydia sp.]